VFKKTRGGERAVSFGLNSQITIIRQMLSHGQFAYGHQRGLMEVLAHATFARGGVGLRGFAEAK